VASELSVIIGWPIRGRGRGQGAASDLSEQGEAVVSSLPTVGHVIRRLPHQPHFEYATSVSYHVEALIAIAA